MNERFSPALLLLTLFAISCGKTDSTNNKTDSLVPRARENMSMTYGTGAGDDDPDPRPQNPPRWSGRILTRYNMPIGRHYPADSVLAVPRIHQENSRWCWAASSEMVLRYLDPPGIEQCAIASARWRIRPPKTCTDLDFMQGSYFPYLAGYSRIQKHDALSYSEIQQEITSKRPFIILWGRSGGGHFMVGCGYHDNNGDPRIEYNDPWPPPDDDADLTESNHTVSPLSEVLYDSVDHVWLDTYYDIQREGAPQHVVATPQHAVATPQHASAATGQRASSTTPRHPSGRTPQHP
jgi:hypothetical protein